MGEFTNGQIEQISTSALNLTLCNFKNIGSFINWNDKEPSWDGNLYLYEDKSQKKELLKGKIPVQVKGTEVKKIERKFVKFQMSLSDIKNYYNDGGVLFFVIQIINTSEFKIFYEFLLPVDLKNLIEEITENGQKTKSVKISNVLKCNSKFEAECEEFLTHKNRQSIGSVEKAVKLESVQGKHLEFIGDQNPFNMVNKDVYFYTKDEYGIHVPIKNKVTFQSVSCKMERDFIINDKLYFDNFEFKKTIDGEVTIIGDGLEYNHTNKTITLKETEKDIIERLNTLEFIENAIDPKNKEYMKDELAVVSEQKEFITRIINVCNKLNIQSTDIKLSEMTQNDNEVLSILENIKTFDELLEENRKLTNACLVRVEFFDNKILLASLENNEHKYYINYFQNGETFDLIGSFKEKKVSLGRFSVLDDIDLLVCNFNLEIVKNSIDETFERCKQEDREELAGQYTLLALEAIKAWDISNNNDYIDLANYIFDRFENYIFDYIIDINKAQIEKRVSGELSKKTEENLYKIKFGKTEEDDDYDEILAAIYILLENEESFKMHFDKISNKKVFMDYPIYTLYSKTDN